MNPADLLNNTCKLLCFNKVTDRERSHTRPAYVSGGVIGQEHYAIMPFKRREPLSVAPCLATNVATYSKCSHN